MQKGLPGEFLDYTSVRITCFILLKVWGGLEMSEIWVLGTSVFVGFFLLGWCKRNCGLKGKKKKIAKTAITFAPT